MMLLGTCETCSSYVEGIFDIHEILGLIVEPWFVGYGY